MRSGDPFGDILYVMAAEQECGAKLRQRIEPLITGVGPIEAAAGVAIRLQQLAPAGKRPRLIVSLGSAGSSRHPAGSVWQISSVSWRDMDASRIGIPKGVTPFADHPATINLPMPLADVPTVALSTGAKVLDAADYRTLGADLADMETFAVVRAAQRFGVPVIGLRGVSDNPGDLEETADWEKRLAVLDAGLADLVDALEAERRTGRLFDAIGYATTDHPKPAGPATDALHAMEAAIEGDRRRKRPARLASVKETGEDVPQEQWERFEAADKKPGKA